MSFWDNIFKEGKINTKFGRPGSGMTQSSILLLERLHEKGYEIYTNIQWGN